MTWAKDKKRISLAEHFSFGKLYRFVLPTVVMMVFTSIYSIVDGIFISRFAGKTPFAAINLIYPFLMVLSSFGFMMGTGGSAIVGKTMGQGDKELANKRFSMIVCSTVVIAFILVGLGQILVQPIAQALSNFSTSDSAEDKLTLVANATLYGRILICGLPLLLLQFVFQSFVITAERPKLGLFSTLAAGFANMIADALFVGVFKWGLIGAASATLLSEAFGGLFPLIYFLSKKNDSALHFRRFNFSIKIILGVMGNGFSELLGNIAGSIVSTIFNIQLLRLVGQDGVAAYGMIMYLQFVFMAIYFGYALGCSPIISYQFGADNQKELQNIVKKSLITTAGMGLLMFGLSFSLSYVLPHLFFPGDQALIDLSGNGFRFTSFIFLFAGFNVYFSAVFTALGNGAISAIISFGRTMVFEVTALLVFPIFLGLTGTWLAPTIADFCAFLLDLVLFLAFERRYHYLKSGPLTAKEDKELF